jgi:hypothetical protein
MTSQTGRRQAAAEGCRFLASLLLLKREATLPEMDDVKLPQSGGALSPGTIVVPNAA